MSSTNSMRVHRLCGCYPQKNESYRKRVTAHCKTLKNFCIRDICFLASPLADRQNINRKMLVKFNIDRRIFLKRNISACTSAMVVVAAAMTVTALAFIVLEIRKWFSGWAQCHTHTHTHIHTLKHTKTEHTSKEKERMNTPTPLKMFLRLVWKSLLFYLLS